MAVDMPFLQPELLSYLIAQARQHRCNGRGAGAGGRLQPFCAVYRQAFAEVAERSLRAGENKIDRLFSEVETRVIEHKEMERNGFTEEDVPQPEHRAGLAGSEAAVVSPVIRSIYY